MNSDSDFHNLPFICYFLFGLFIFIAICCSFLVFDIDISKLPFNQLLMKTVFVNANAESVSGSGYLGQKVCFMGSCSDGIDSNVSQQLFFPTNTYTIINGYTGSVGNRSYTYVRLLYLYFTNSTFSANNTYKIVFTLDTGTGINYETRTLTYCGNSADVSRCSISWNDLYDSSLNHYTATIYYTPTTTVSSPTFIIGSSTGNHYFLYNSTSTNQGVRIVSMDVTVDNTGTGAIINNNNQNTQNIINSQTEINNSINDVNDSLNDSSLNNGLGSQFLNLFSHNEHALASIVTAPLNFLNSLDDSCQPITIPFKLGGGNGCGGLPVCVNSTYSKNATIQCGDTLFWNKSDVSVFRVFWNALFGGAIIYMLGFKLFKTINRALDPFVDDINGLEV